MSPTLKKRLPVLISVFIILILLGYGCTRVIGGQREKTIPIPTSLQDAQIVFNKPMYYEIGLPEEATKTFQRISRHITGSKFLDQHYPGRFTYELVPTGMKFTVVNAINHANYGLAAMDSGTTGIDFLVLQDENGKQAFIAYLEFTNEIDTNGTLRDVKSASYYKDGQRVGDVVLPF
ncbi:MAG: hypothetical protein WC895_04200 [Candidatus Shapirobacteria bacterium]|jgi:hypothetical protein